MREIFTEEFLKTKEVTFSAAAFKQKRSVTVRSQEQQLYSEVIQLRLTAVKPDAKWFLQPIRKDAVGQTASAS